MNDAMQIPGVTNAWTMPVKGRIDMLTTGMRTPLGVKVFGADPAAIGEIGSQIEAILPSVRGTRTVFSERPAEGHFLDIEWRRGQLARYGLGIDQAQSVVQSAIGGESVTTTIEGRARYPVNVRYMRDYRSDPGALERVLVPIGDGKKQVPLGELADVKVTAGPSMLRDEDGLLTGYVYVDIAGRDLGGYVEEARRTLAQKLHLPAGYSLRWTGQYESMERVRERLLVVVPATLFLIVWLLYLNTRSIVKTLMVLLAVPFSAIGAFWFVYLLGYNLSVAVWIGLIALLGVDAETGVFMLLYLDLAYRRAKEEGRLRTRADLHRAVLAGAVKRIRPKFMTAATMFLGLVPILWSTGAGADVMKRIAAPMIGGIFTSFALELIVYPVVYEVWKWRFEMEKGQKRADRSAELRYAELLQAESLR
jgi:Cu(I)/Ag(I) efflux system membrane protein CusA/SilA